jgi:hypothetical protein
VGRPTIPPEGRGGRSLLASLRLGTRMTAAGPGGVKSRSSVAGCIDERQEPALGLDLWGRREAGDGRHLPLASTGERGWRTGRTNPRAQPLQSLPGGCEWWLTAVEGRRGWGRFGLQ